MTPSLQLTAVPERVKGCCNPVAKPLPVREADQLAAVFKALADPTRVQMVHMLKAADEPVCVCDFTAVFQLEQPTISHHLARLREAGLVSSVRRGIWSFYQLRDDLSPATNAALSAVR
ncbi:MAG TPA: metalloregulator ArsR/SmtB family transcription factor [Candidatus Dormibacteraeota bacterium]|nr:metalloregulator ArsR/SmtB family transcription factor [Candidatus Dormibacteraeota bacterium]